MFWPVAVACPPEEQFLLERDWVCGCMVREEGSSFFGLNSLLFFQGKVEGNRKVGRNIYLSNL